MTMEDLTHQQAMYDRAHDLCRCTNLRVYKKSWEESDWSPYQEAVIRTILNLPPTENSSTTPALSVHGPWSTELSVATAALNEVMGEMPPGSTLHGDRPPVKKSDLN